MIKPSLISTNPWGNRLVSLLLTLLGVSFIGILVLSSYYEQPVTQALSFRVQDNERYDSGMGIHSFGDFQELRFALPSEKYPNVWINSDVAYAPSAFIPNQIAKWLQNFFGVQVSLYVFLLALFLCLAVPALCISRKQFTVYEKILVMLLFSICAQPVIMTMDRGNSVGFAAPFLMIFARSFYVDRNSWPLIIGLAGATALRPQFALIGVALLVTRCYRKILISALISISIFFISFLFMPGDYSDNFSSWYLNFTKYSERWRPLVFPANLSLSSAFGGSFFKLWYFQITVTLLLLIILIFGFLRTKNDRARILLTCLALPCLLVELSFAYYAIFVLVIAALIMLFPDFLNLGEHQETFKSKMLIKINAAYNWLIISAVAISLAPLPFVREVGRNSVALESFSSLWILVLIATLLIQVFEYFNYRAGFQKTSQDDFSKNQSS